MSDTSRPGRRQGATQGTTRRAPRQARSTETRRRLLEAGFEAFAAKGFEGVNLVDDVIEPAGISVGSFYHQFADKSELLREILIEAAARRRTFIVQLGELDTATDLPTTVRVIIERLFDSLERDAAAWKLQRLTRVTGVDGVGDLGPLARENWNAELAVLLGRWFDRPLDELRRASDVTVTLTRGFIYDVLDAPARTRRERGERIAATSSFLVGGLTALLGPPRP